MPAISPLEEHRELARRVTTEAGLDFFEVFCDTPLEDCERRDPKGLRQGRAGGVTSRDRQPVPAANPDAADTGPVDRELADLVVGLLESRR